MGRRDQASILVVDDFAPWRDKLRSWLQARPEWRIIAEASNGQQAIEKAAELQPDIILLDIEMPRLNGMEAAKIIHQRCPKSRILFVTQECDGEVMDAAMRLGAAGYVRKADAGRELLDTMTTALDGQETVLSTKSR